MFKKATRGIVLTLRGQGGRAGPSIVLNELCPEKTKEEGASRERWCQMSPEGQPILHSVALGSASGKPGLESAEMSMETQTSIDR